MNSQTTGNFAYDIIENWQNFEKSQEAPNHKKKKKSPFTTKNKIKSYLQKISSTTCEKDNCFSCTKTPKIDKLKTYMKPH